MIASLLALGIVCAAPDAAAAEASPRQQFEEQAWRLEVTPHPLAGALSLVRAAQRRAVVTDGSGAEVGMDELRAAAPKARWSSGLAASAAFPWVAVGVAAAAPAVALALALVGGVVGAVTMAILTPLMIPGASWSQPTPSGVPLTMGMVAGLMMGSGMGAASILPLAFVGAQVVSAFLPSGDGTSAVQQAVLAHNWQLAQQLNVDPATFPAEYFPATQD